MDARGDEEVGEPVECREIDVVVRVVGSDHRRDDAVELLHGEIFFVGSMRNQQRNATAYNAANE